VLKMEVAEVPTVEFIAAKLAEQEHGVHHRQEDLGL